MLPSGNVDSGERGVATWAKPTEKNAEMLQNFAFFRLWFGRLQRFENRWQLFAIIVDTCRASASGDGGGGNVV